ncbi:MAG: TrmH family RNA methyltransferase [Microbacteriaceae bacterium]
MLEDPKANRIRGVAKLNKKDARSETGLFLLEGFQGLKEALDRPKLIRDIFVTESAHAEHAELFERAVQARVSVTLVSETVLKALVDTQTPQGVVAVCEQMHVDVDGIWDSQARLVALLANIRDPGNAGTVLRAADAAGADAVVFSDNSVDVFNPKVVRSTTGSLFHLPVAVGASSLEFIAQAKAAGFQVFAASGGGVSIADLSADILAKPTLWVFGNEAWGFEPEVLAAVDQVVAVPIYGAAESLNLATAASICLYATAFAQNR